MAFSVRDIINRNLFPGLRLAAGIRGIENPVTWVNIMEILDTPESTKPGELLITTGYGLADKAKYSDVISKLKARGVSGIAVQPGYYIDHIPDFILEEANHCALPILNLPPDYSFSDILRVLIREIGSEPELMTPEGFDSGYFLQTLTEELAEREDFFSDHSSAQLICIRAVSANAVRNGKTEEALKEFSGRLRSQASGFIPVTRAGGPGCFLLSLSEKSSFSPLLYDLQIQLSLLSEQTGLNFYAGCDGLQSKEELPSAFRRAAKCISLLRKIEAKRGICAYENYSFIENFGLLYQAGRHHFIQNEQLQLLLEKDRSKGSDYVRTLRIYLSENCNTSRTADRLFIHRHTLLNRLESIRGLSGLDLRDYYSRLAMSCALLIHDFYGA